ncbi:MAG: hypothetical protein ACE5G8_06350 [Anaerolineae bacterium]
MTQQSEHYLNRIKKKIILLGQLNRQQRATDKVIDANLQTWPDRGRDAEEQIEAGLDLLKELMSEIQVAAMISRESKETKDIFTDRLMDVATLMTNVEYLTALDKNFAVAFLGYVEVDVLRAGLEGLDAERLAEVAGVMAEVADEA